MDASKNLVINLFTKIISLYARNVSLGEGSFITMGFGNDLPIKVIKRRQRQIETRPEWYLWVYMSFWEIKFKNEMLATNDDDENTMKNALTKLENRKLIDVKAPNDNLILEFEDGISIYLIPNPAEDEQWMLFTPEKKVLTAGSFGRFSYENEN